MSLELLKSISSIADEGLGIISTLHKTVIHHREKSKGKSTEETVLRTLVTYNLFNIDTKEAAKKFKISYSFVLKDSKEKEIKSEKEIKKLCKNKSYIILGDGGAGKSSFLVNDFINIQRKYKRFYTSKDIINFDSQKTLFPSITKIVIYLDGLDEIGYNQQNINKLRELIMSYVYLYKKDLLLKISCRSKYYYNVVAPLLHDIGNIVPCLSIYTIEPFGHTDMKNKNAIMENKEKFWKELPIEDGFKTKFDSNILNKLKSTITILLYRKVLSEETYEKTSRELSNKSDYEIFFYLLIENLKIANPDIVNTKYVLNEIAFEIFKSYVDPDYEVTINNLLNKKYHDAYSIISYISKKGITQSRVSFLHQSFYDYFLVRYYINVFLRFSQKELINKKDALKSIDGQQKFPSNLRGSYFKDLNLEEIIEILKLFYRRMTDTYSDLIRDAINGKTNNTKNGLVDDKYNPIFDENKKANLIKNLIALYYMVEEYKSCEDVHNALVTILSKSNKLEELKEEELIQFKTGIMLRFSKIRSYDDNISIKHLQKNELQHIYMCLDSKDKTKENYTIQMYSSLCLMWLCAEYEDSYLTECDFIDKIWNNRSKNSDYQVACRTQFMYYYEDIDDCEYYDTDEFNSCKKSLHNIHKRFESYKKDDIEENMKKYRFRLMNLFGFYLFLHSRGKDCCEECITDVKSLPNELLPNEDLEFFIPGSIDKSSDSYKKRNELYLKLKELINEEKI